MKKQSLALSFTLALLSTGCVTVPNTVVCTVAGVMDAGAICAETNTTRTYRMTLDQLLDMLEPQPERPDPANPGKVLPARGGALIMSSRDWNRLKTATEQACRQDGSKCNYDKKEVTP